MDLSIAAMDVLSVEGAAKEARGPWQGQVQPIHLYPDERNSGGRGTGAVGSARRVRSLYLEVTASNGLRGRYGPIDEEAARPIVSELGRWLVGHDALGGSVTWDKLQRRDRHARHGHLKMAISAIDNALWDLRGRAFGAPVWQLLGGAARGVVPAYASTLGLSHAEGSLEGATGALAEQGYAAQKWFFAHGPADGATGFAANVALVERLRAVLGPHYPLMFDAFMSWDVRYARAWAEAVEVFSPYWLEEPVAPGAYRAYCELRRSVRVPIAGGEHLYDRFEVLPFLQDGSLAILQTDPEWCGGVTELVRICALAETFGVPVVPHGHGLHAALHVVASQSPAVCPMVEYLVSVMPQRHYFERSAPVPSEGGFPLPTEPGFGIEFDPERADTITPWRATSGGST